MVENILKECETMQQNDDDDDDDLEFPRTEIETAIQLRAQRSRLSLRHQSNKSSHVDAEITVNVEMNAKNADVKPQMQSPKEKSSKKTSMFSSFYFLSIIFCNNFIGSIYYQAKSRFITHRPSRVKKNWAIFIKKPCGLKNIICVNIIAFFSTFTHLKIRI